MRPSGPDAPALPFAALNLRRNPFGELDPSEIASVAVAGPELPVGEIERRASSGLSGAPLAVQLVGPPGCGKSARLLALRRLLPAAPLVAWSATGGWPPVPPGPLLLVDDAHLLPRGLRRKVLGRRVLVVATHRDLGTKLRRRRFEVRTVRVAATVTHESLGRMVERRMERARRGPGPLPRIGGEELRGLLDRHGPDVRAIMDELYRWIQRLGSGSVAAAVARTGLPGRAGR